MTKKELELFLQKYEAEMQKAANDMRKEAMPEITEDLFALFETTGDRTTYERVYFRRRKFLAVYGMASILWKKEEDFHKLCEVIRGICGEVCWALPAHVDRTKKDWMRTVDLFASETAFALAEIEAVLGRELPSELYSLIRENIMDRVLLPFENSAVPYGVWENCEHNWNAVCAGSVGSAAIYLLKEEPERLQNLLARLLNSLVHYVEGFADDGACMEGVGYFTYGMSYYCTFAEKLFAYTDGKVDLMRGEKLKKIMEFQQKCYFPGGLSVSFSDGSSREKFRMGLTCYLSMKDGDVKFPSMSLAAGLDSDQCYRWAEIYRDIFFTRSFLEKLEDTQKAAEPSPEKEACQETLPFAQWTICRGACAAGMAAKGGHNGEPHNHNDVGSFHYVVGDEMFLADLGAGEYTKEYFRDETRYQIFVNQSQSHNLPLIEGEGEKPGREYACRNFFTDGKGNTEMELEGAYGQKKLEKFVRKIAFCGEDGSLQVEDAFRGEAGMSVVESLVTPWLPEIRGNQVLLKGERHQCLLSIDTKETLRIEKRTYPDHRANEKTVYLLQWPCDMSTGEGKALFGIRVFSRLSNPWENSPQIF